MKYSQDEIKSAIDQLCVEIAFYRKSALTELTESSRSRYEAKADACKIRLDEVRLLLVELENVD